MGDLRQRQFVPDLDRGYGSDLLLGPEEYKGFEYTGDSRLILGVFLWSKHDMVIGLKELANCLLIVIVGLMIFLAWC